MTTAPAVRPRWPRRHPIVLFWVLTAPLVLQLSYYLMEHEQSSVTDSSFAVWATYLLAQLGYALLLISLVWLRRAYWDWIERI